MIEYWHWHTLHFGVETYWGGVLPHSQVPGRIYAEVKELGDRLTTLGGRLDGYVPDHDVTVLFSNTSKYAFEVHPFLAEADGSPRARCYLDLIESFLSAVLHSGRQSRVLHEQQFDDLDVADLVREHPVLVAAGFYTATTAQLEKLRDFALAGGHLVVGIRTGYGDQESRARFAAVTTTPAGAGRVTYVGTLPDRALGAALFSRILPEPVAGDWSRSAEVTVFSGATERGRAFFVHNWGPEPRQATLPLTLTDAFTGADHPAGHHLDLPAWSVVVLLVRDTGTAAQKRRV